MPDYANDARSLGDRLESFYADHQNSELSGLRVKELPRHNTTQKPTQVNSSEAWRDGIRETRGY